MSDKFIVCWKIDNIYTSYAHDLAQFAEAHVIRLQQNGATHIHTIIERSSRNLTLEQV